MAGRRRRRPCKYCRELFLPDPHVKNQKACGSASCAEERKAESQANWLGKPANRSYFCGRYDYLKAWLQRPEKVGYLSRWRERRRAVVRVAPCPAAALPPPSVWPGKGGHKWPDIQDASPLEIGSMTGSEASITS